jgi:hypothetical protein
VLGAIAGDIIGSVYEARPIKTTKFSLFHPFCRFTDDPVLTVALADSLMHRAPFVGLLKQYYRAHPHAGFGGSFHQWAQSEDSRPYNSWGIGSAMRVSPVGFASLTLDDVLAKANQSAEVTHDHPEGIKGRKQSHRRSSSPAPGRPRSRSRITWNGHSATTSTERWTRSAQSTGFRSPARSRFRRRSGHSWSRIISRMPCGRRSPWAGTATRWIAWRGHRTGFFRRRARGDY